MNYELAKELKDAGFPQNPLSRGGWRTRKKIQPDPDYPTTYTNFDEVSEPTLFELIEACGDRFGELERCCTGEWRASDIEYKEVFTKDTKEEAVARLWLALNEKV